MQLKILKHITLVLRYVVLLKLVHAYGTQALNDIQMLVP